MSAKRNPISKKVRFEVFKRDNFTCQYCGQNPPAITLELDHIHPVSKGGEDQIDNLITSCFDCNRGKSDTLLTDLPATVAAKAELLEERESQLAEYNKLIKRKKTRENKNIKAIEKVFEEYFPEKSFAPKFKESIRNNFLPALGVDQCERAMHKACAKISNPDQAIKYFCGICWNCIKGGTRLG